MLDGVLLSATVDENAVVARGALLKPLAVRGPSDGKHFTVREQVERVLTFERVAAVHVAARAESLVAEAGTRAAHRRESRQEVAQALIVRVAEQVQVRHGDFKKRPYSTSWYAALLRLPFPFS